MLQKRKKKEERKKKKKKNEEKKQRKILTIYKFAGYLHYVDVFQHHASEFQNLY